MSTAEAAAHDDHHHDSPYLTLPADRDYGTATPGKIGMWMLLLSDAFSFIGMLLAYGILRGHTENWYPAYLPHLGINFTALMTFVLISSSATMVRARATPDPFSVCRGSGLPFPSGRYRMSARRASI